MNFDFATTQYLIGFSLGLGVWFLTLGANHAWKAFRFIVNG